MDRGSSFTILVDGNVPYLVAPTGKRAQLDLPVSKVYVRDTLKMKNQLYVTDCKTTFSIDESQFNKESLESFLGLPLTSFRTFEESLQAAVTAARSGHGVLPPASVQGTQPTYITPIPSPSSTAAMGSVQPVPVRTRSEKRALSDVSDSADVDSLSRSKGLANHGTNGGAQTMGSGGSTAVSLGDWDGSPMPKTPRASIYAVASSSATRLQEALQGQLGEMAKAVAAALYKYGDGSEDMSEAVLAMMREGHTIDMDMSSTMGGTESRVQLAMCILRLLEDGRALLVMNPLKFRR